MLTLLRPNGFTGCITSSSFVLYTDLSDFRDFLLNSVCLEHFANLGEGVLDTAYVYTASYIIRKDVPPRKITFLDLRKEKDKATALLSLTSEMFDSRARCLPPSRFMSLIGQPLCHWAPDSLFCIVRDSPVLEVIIDDAGVGAAPQADFFSLWWEVPANCIGFRNRWVPIVNGGGFSPFARTDALVVDWEDDGRRAKEDLNRRYPYLKGNVGLRIQRTDRYGQPGITFGKRSDRFNAQVMRQGSIFTFEGIGVFTKLQNNRTELGLLAFLNSRFVSYFLNLTAGLHKNDVYVRRIPYRFSQAGLSALGELAAKGVKLVQTALSVEEGNHFFSGAIFRSKGSRTLRESATDFKIKDRLSEAELFEICSLIDVSVNDQYGIDSLLEAEIAEDQGGDLWNLSRREIASTETILVPDKMERGRQGFSRSEFETSSDLYRACIANMQHPCDVLAYLNKLGFLEEETLSWFAKSLVSYSVGVISGRWDIRFATGERQPPELPDPFDPLPVCPPGMLQGPDGLPAKPEDIPSDYHIRIDWDGILVDDPGHDDDIVRRVRDVLEVIWKDRAEVVEREACEILGVRELRDYFRKPGNGGFWIDHVKRYSKSRRKAPIYWYLRSGKGNYGLWLYYHRLDKDILFKALLNYVEPKIRLEEDRLKSFRGRKEAAGSSGREAKQIEKDMDRQDQFVSELHDFADKLRRAANLHLVPDLNDGVVLNIAPLFELVPWKEAKEYWEDLVAGKYEWSSIGKQIREKGLVKI